MLKANIVIGLILILSGAYAQVPMGHPGLTPNWSSAKKIQVGTSKNIQSHVWFTNAQGVLTETYFPTIDKAQIKDAGLLISDNKSFMVEERLDTIQEVKQTSASLTTLINKDKLNRFEIEHTFYTLDDRAVIVDEVVVNAKIDNLAFYLLVNPALNNTGFKDSGYIVNDSIIFQEETTTLKVSSTIGFEQLSVGFVGFTDGYQDLVKDFQIDFSYPTAIDGNIAGTAKLKTPALKGTYKFYVIYSFENSMEEYSVSFLEKQKELYESKWEQYFSNLRRPKNLSFEEEQLYLRSLYVLKVHEDKINPGALIASLSKPWGESTYEQPGVQVGGYHMVWPRDLYHVCTALINAGDLTTAKNALGFLKRIQYQNGNWRYSERDIPRLGAFPQNVWVDTQEYWGGLQLDQTAYPVHIFYQLWLRADQSEKSELLREYGQMLKLALDFINFQGPWTAQERWEENYGISPSTFSAATSALIMGHKIFQDETYLKTANDWLTKPNDNIHTWTFTENGKFDDGKYYIRIGGCSSHLAQWNPNSGEYCHVANSWNKVEQTQMVDQGFLKLALLGLVPANDWRIKKSKEVLDNHIKIKTPHGDGWYRYSFDAYGEQKKGRLWPLLSGEHARYAIERFKVQDLSWSDASKIVDETIASYIGFANDGGMIPEQVWEDSGEGTGAATPLAWSHAEYIKLLWSKEHKTNVENLIK